MFRPLLAAARRGAGVRCARGGRPLRRCRLLGLRRPFPAAAVRRPLGRAGRLLQDGRRRRRADGELDAPAHPRRRRDGRPHRPRPQRPPRPHLGRAAGQRHPLRHQARRRPGARARLGEHDERRPGRPAPRLRRRGRRWSRLRLPRPRGAPAAFFDGREDPQRDPPHRARQVLALPDDPPEPGQLVRADVRRRRDRDRRQHPAQARHAPAAQALLLPDARRRRRGSATSVPACASTTCRT